MKGDKTVEAFVEIFSGIVRSGPGCTVYGDPFDFAVAFVSNAGIAEIKGLVSENETFTPAHAKAIIKALKAVGLKSQWRRMKSNDDAGGSVFRKASKRKTKKPVVTRRRLPGRRPTARPRIVVRRRAPRRRAA